MSIWIDDFCFHLLLNIRYITRRRNSSRTADERVIKGKSCRNTELMTDGSKVIGCHIYLWVMADIWKIHDKLSDASSPPAVEKLFQTQWRQTCFLIPPHNKYASILWLVLKGRPLLRSQQVANSRVPLKWCSNRNPLNVLLLPTLLPWLTLSNTTHYNLFYIHVALPPSHVFAYVCVCTHKSRSQTSINQ